MVPWICAGVSALLAVILFLWFLSSGGRYKAIFADEHIIEFSRGIGPVKEAAFGNPGLPSVEQPMTLDDPRQLITSAGLMLYYTLRQQSDEEYIHHYSLSVGGGLTAHAVGEMFILLTAKLLGIPYERLQLAVATSSVHHAEFVLSKTENDQLRVRNIQPLSPAEIAAFRGEWLNVREKLHWDRITVSATPE